MRVGSLTKSLSFMVLFPEVAMAITPLGRIGRAESCPCLLMKVIGDCVTRRLYQSNQTACDETAREQISYRKGDNEMYYCKRECL